MAQQNANQFVNSAYQPVENKRQYQARYRHFHPADRLVLRNPFEEDIEFLVADDSGRQLEYVMPANERCELPGGACATLGLKTIVDRMIQEDSEDDPGLYLNIYNPDIRKKYEEKVILRYVPAPVTAANALGGSNRVNLGQGESKAEDSRSGDYTFKISKSGQEQWRQNGILVSVRDVPADVQARVRNAEATEQSENIQVPNYARDAAAAAKAGLAKEQVIED